MIDLKNRFTSAPGSFPDLYEEERQAAFRVRAEEAIDRCREEDDPHPVILLVYPSSRYYSRLVAEAESMAEKGGAIEVPYYEEGVRAFVLTNFLSRSLLCPWGRYVWTVDFVRLLEQRMSPEGFYMVDVHDREIEVREHQPGSMAAV
jgi:hypothetical protein